MKNGNGMSDFSPPLEASSRTGGGGGGGERENLLLPRPYCVHFINTLL